MTRISFLRNKKGDLYDYFSNYGWLFIFLMLTFLALFAIGFYNFGLTGNIFCKISRDIICREAYKSQNMISFVIQNGKTSPIQITAVQLIEEYCGARKVYEKPVYLYPKNGHRVTFECDIWPKKVNVVILVEYLNAYSGLPSTKKGTIRFFS